MRSLGTETYNCAVCGETFTKGRSDEEARAEQHELWGDLPDEECDILCDDCFVEFMAWMKTAEGHA